MIKISKLFSGIFSALALMLAYSDAFAGVASGTISYIPYVNAIPTLSDAMLIVLSMLFAIVAFRALRVHSAGKPLSSLVAMGVLALSATSGHYLIQNALATSYSFVFTNGGSPASVYGNNLQEGQNQSGKPIQITSVNPTGCHTAFSTSSPYLPQCKAGLVLQNNATCWVDFEC